MICTNNVTRYLSIKKYTQDTTNKKYTKDWVMTKQQENYSGKQQQQQQQQQWKKKNYKVTEYFLHYT